jgi:hypothetical protein
MQASGMLDSKRSLLIIRKSAIEAAFHSRYLMQH